MKLFEFVAIRVESGSRHLVGKGTTFGCSCCSDTLTIGPGDVIAKIRETQTIYEQLAARHKLMADTIERLGKGKVARALKAIDIAEYAWSRLDSATRAQIDNTGGTWGQDLLKRHGIDHLKEVYEKALARVTAEDLKIGLLVGRPKPRIQQPIAG